ncbi:hypothetical protein MPL1_13187 [Methylophaga lonarensis MPL]|uniref:Methyltransferase type 11 domain-containing protein n=1 Tax=Methylophaga lonarensis MPL TaxID=1286106 RepID=M7NT07_9GAMM|nr:class I SAM-dependent methyltransferase [Methylophaga lonarensis]EMR11903.1 hypothetical protein MPL1_13187 [Methylophaga lonarensis MPL]
MKSFLKIKNKLMKIVARFGWPRKRYCVFCEKPVSRFLPYRNGSRGRSAFTKAMQVVGSDVDNFSCPRCGCHDRERHLYLYVQKLALYNQLSGYDVLHFAPEKRLSELLGQIIKGRYTKADLYPASADIKQVDITKMAFNDQNFDLIIANHVLEHVDDASKALNEIYRVVKKGGYCILQTPYSEKLQHTFSDPGINDEIDRFQAYGQEDHVRLFGNDIFDIITKAGFESMVTTHNQLLPDIDATRYGVNPREPLFLFRRPM